MHGRMELPNLRRQLSLAQAVWGKLNAIGRALVVGMKTLSLDVLSQYSVFYL